MFFEQFYPCLYIKIGTRDLFIAIQVWSSSYGLVEAWLQKIWLSSVPGHGPKKSIKGNKDWTDIINLNIEDFMLYTAYKGCSYDNQDES